jgi:hypothetical protein
MEASRHRRRTGFQHPAHGLSAPQRQAHRSRPHPRRQPRPSLKATIKTRWQFQAGSHIPGPPRGGDECLRTLVRRGHRVPEDDVARNRGADRLTA